MATPLYTTVDRVIGTLPSIGSVTTLSSESIMTLFLEPTEARVNARLSKLYTVPVSGNPPLLDHITREITCYLIMTRRLISGDQKISTQWPDRYKEAITMLDEISQGIMPLITGSGTAIQPLAAGAGVAWSNTMDYSPTFSDNADEWSSTIDDQKLADIDADKS